MWFNFKLIFLFIIFFSDANKDIKKRKGEDSINYKSIPKFKLSDYFVIIYGGPIYDKNIKDPLDHGFTHIELWERMNLYSLLKKKNRAIGIYNTYTSSWGDYNIIGKYNPSNWEKSKEKYPECFSKQNSNITYFNPWNNNLSTNYFPYYNWLSNDKQFKGKDFDYIWFNFEAALRDPNKILELQCPSILTGKDKEKLHYSKHDFIDNYYYEMSNIYDSCIVYITQNLINPTFSYRTIYKENSPIIYPETLEDFNNINFHKLNYGKLNPLLNNNNQGFNRNKLYQNCNLNSADLYAPVNFPIKNSNYAMSVANLIELNMGISKKPVVPFVWLKKSGPTPFCKDGKVNFEMERISSQEAEALAPVSLMCGAKGLHLWDIYEEAYSCKDDIDNSIYESFINGLKLLSKYNSFFDKKHYYLSSSPVIKTINNKTTLWRGVLTNNKMLLMIYNPWVAKNEEFSITIKIGKKNRIITGIGNKCKFLSFNNVRVMDYLNLDGYVIKSSI